MKRRSTTPPAENATNQSKFSLKIPDTIGKTDGVFICMLQFLTSTSFILPA